MRKLILYFWLTIFVFVTLIPCKHALAQPVIRPPFEYSVKIDEIRALNNQGAETDIY